ncbi:ABC-type antimicrobial peptide transport system, ATPase component [Aciduliprofundum sp. MAR08-339]|nr:ABC-type antimicrobial peptide transport system, ATPase component [Aciduliprofundum sp. MAR08-339]
MYLNVSNVSKTYGSYMVLRRVNLNVDRGYIVMIKGQSGVGKTTLLNIISGLEIPDEGSVKIENIEITKLSENERAKFRLQRIGIIFQSTNLIDDLTVMENVALPLKLAGKRWKERVEDLLEYFGIKEKMHSFPSSLSGGEMQRVAIARALANDPELLIADEPTSNLDDENTENIVELMKKINKELGVTIILATHDPRLEKLNARKYIMKEGSLYEG